MRPLLLLLALVTLAVPAQARLSREEQRMVAAVDAGQDRSIALLERLVNQNSGSLNLEGVRAVGQMMRAELEPPVTRAARGPSPRGDVGRKREVRRRRRPPARPRRPLGSEPIATVAVGPLNHRAREVSWRSLQQDHGGDCRTQACPARGLTAWQALLTW